MLITTSIDENTVLTDEQLKRITEGAKYPIQFDEDCPESTPEQLKQFHRVNGTAF